MPADSMNTQPLLAALIVSLVAVLPATYAMLDIRRHPDTRQLTPQTWLVICAFGNLVGLIAYLRFGRSEDR
ncbi:PLDc N-terminal domain-containing protein [Streptosporangiaceae bacterium NEAU-GS5]|nr:PLDc N-terminal domain-containing protein [Streptosporangiaceae bacterium NEAU-GS5]